MKLNPADIATIITKRLYIKDGVVGLYCILDGLTGKSLMTHQLPVAADFCRPQIMKQLKKYCPELWTILSTWKHSEAWESQICELLDRFEPIEIKIDMVKFEEHMYKNSLLNKTY